MIGGRVIVVPACDSAINRNIGPKRFKENLLAYQAHGAVLVVDNSHKEKDFGLTPKTAGEVTDWVIPCEKISAGYARFYGITHAFRFPETQVVVIADDDGHVLPESISSLAEAVEKGADLALGQRSLGNMATHPLWQWGLEEWVNTYATLRFFMLPKISRSSVTLTPDFVSGGQAFGRAGWARFLEVVNQEEMRRVGPGATFFPGMFNLLGLKVEQVKINAPYEGDYFKDSVDPKEITKRWKNIRRDLRDVELAVEIYSKYHKLGKNGHS